MIGATVSEAFNEDCMVGMSRFPDKYFDLAVVDPPYGIGADIKNNGKNSQRHEETSLAKINTYKKTNWDNKSPDDSYFKELIRVSKKQVVWGANHYGLSGGMLYWHKNVTMPTYSTGEIAWCSWLSKVDFVEITWHGMMQYDMKNKEDRIHPTQKPIALYEWIYKSYLPKGGKVIDTHLGSGSNRIAADKAGNIDFYGWELDKDYFDAQEKRWSAFKAQTRLI